MTACEPQKKQLPLAFADRPIPRIRKSPCDQKQSGGNCRPLFFAYLQPYNCMTFPFRNFRSIIISSYDIIPLG